MQPLLTLFMWALFFLGGAFGARYNSWSYYPQAATIATTIIVDQDGEGNFTSVQKAIDSIPSNNPNWVRVQINPGTYTEKVEIPREKPFIFLEGDRNQLPVIQYGDGGSVVESPTLKVHADNFVAKNIIFKNTYNQVEIDTTGRPVTWAVAATIDADKASFYHCTFSSLQDTLSDATGRHYFYDCTIEGAIDFIFGSAQSVFEKCQLISRTDEIGHAGYITANGRGGPDDPAGFVFTDCHISGKGPINLGRAYGNYSRVLFYGTYMENVITPEGWTSAWNKGHEDIISFSEVNCSGPGAGMSHRIPWEKKLSDEEVMKLTNKASFINQDGWLENQPS